MTKLVEKDSFLRNKFSNSSIPSENKSNLSFLVINKPIIDIYSLAVNSSCT